MDQSEILRPWCCGDCQSSPCNKIKCRASNPPTSTSIFSAKITGSTSSCYRRTSPPLHLPHTLKLPPSDSPSHPPFPSSSLPTSRSSIPLNGRSSALVCRAVEGFSRVFKRGLATRRHSPSVPTTASLKMRIKRIPLSICTVSAGTKSSPISIFPARPPHPETPLTHAIHLHIILTLPQLHTIHPF